MALQRRSTCTFPLELVDIMMAFAEELSYIGDVNEVLRKERTLDKDYLLLNTRRRKDKERHNKRPIRLLLSLGLVCRAWLVLSRKHLYADTDFRFDVVNGPDIIEKFIELLLQADRLPNFSNFLSFFTRTTIRCPPNYYHSGDLSKLLKAMSNKETYFRPRHLQLTTQGSLATDVFPLVSSVYSTITVLWTNSPDTADIIRLLTSFPKLQTYNGIHRIEDETHFDMSQHRLPDSLQTVTLDFWLPFFDAMYHEAMYHESSNLLPFTEWLQSHPPAPNIRHLDLRWGTYYTDAEFIKAFLDICPNLNTLKFRAKRDHHEKFTIDWGDYSVFDLSSVTTLHDLTFDIVPLLDYRNCGGSMTLEAVGRILQTVKSSKLTITLRLDIYRHLLCYDEECKADWWTTIDQAMSKLPQDVTLTILAVHPWENDQEKEAFIVDHFRTMLLPRTQEQSKLKVITEIAVFPDDDNYLD